MEPCTLGRLSYRIKFERWRLADGWPGGECAAQPHFGMGTADDGPPGARDFEHPPAQREPASLICGALVACDVGQVVGGEEHYQTLSSGLITPRAPRLSTWV